MVLVKGRAELREEAVSLIVEEASLFEEGKAKVKKKEARLDFEISVPSRISSRKLVELNKLLKQNQGQDRIALRFVDNLGKARRMALPYGVNYTKELKREIENLVSE